MIRRVVHPFFAVLVLVVLPTFGRAQVTSYTQKIESARATYDTLTSATDTAARAHKKEALVPQGAQKLKGLSREQIAEYTPVLPEPPALAALPDQNGLGSVLSKGNPPVSAVPEKPELSTALQHKLKSKSVAGARAKMNAYKEKIQKGNQKLEQGKRQWEKRHDLFRWSNSLKEQPLLKRFRPQVEIEVFQNASDLQFDLAGGTSYAVNDQLSVSLLYLYRLSQNMRNAPAPVYGPRASVAYLFYKSYRLLFTYEQLRATDAQVNGSEDIRQWHTGALVGFGKTFALLDQVNGRISFNYNLTHTQSAPFQNAYHVRLLFGLTESKKKAFKNRVRKMRSKLADIRPKYEKSITPGK